MGNFHYAWLWIHFHIFLSASLLSYHNCYYSLVLYWRGCLLGVFFLPDFSTITSTLPCLLHANILGRFCSNYHAYCWVWIIDWIHYSYCPTLHMQYCQQYVLHPFKWLSIRSDPITMPLVSVGEKNQFYSQILEYFLMFKVSLCQCIPFVATLAYTKCRFHI